MQPRRSLLFLLHLLVFASLGGCATNRLRVESATDVAQKGNDVAERARAFLSQLEQARYATNADMIAADPVCYHARADFRDNAERVRDPLRPTPGWLCDTSGDGLDVAPLVRQMQPTWSAIQALADYSSAVSKALEGNAPGASGDLANAYASAVSARRFLLSLGGGTAPAGDARVAAVGNLIGFFDELQREALTVNRLRALRRDMSPNIARLRTHLTGWMTSRRGDDTQMVVISALLLQAAAHAEPPLTPGQRRDFAQGYYERARVAAAARSADEAFIATLDALVEAEEDFSRLLQPDPNLTDEERARRASIIRQRLTRTLDLAAAVIAPGG